ncbi:MAG: hypothetical protein FJZ59_01120 [Chlamydiae bacterium]|jgi:hypothetical protein|nr:hypothetical protein [Chlamydiota bacterium]
MKINPESNINRLAESGGMTKPVTSSKVSSLARRHIPIIGSSDSLKTRADNQLPLKTTEKAHNTAKNLHLFTQRI